MAALPLGIARTAIDALVEITARGKRPAGAAALSVVANFLEPTFIGHRSPLGYRVMLETPTAIANAEEIAAVPGVAVLLIGTKIVTGL
jgi:2-keto-3-deoxy-L-rhamnonate aldolase RhmA